MVEVSRSANPDIGTARLSRRFRRMGEPLPVLVESSLQIAWDYLEAVGEIADPRESAELLLRSIQAQILRGETRALMLSNRAIDAYRQQCRLVS